MRVASLLSFTALVLTLARPVALSQSQTGRMFAFDRELPVRLPPKPAWVAWNGRKLLRVEDLHQSQVPVYVFDPEGNQEEEIWFEIPDAGRVFVYAPAFAADGTIAMIGSAYSSDAKGALWLGLISPDRKRQSVIRIWPYVPDEVAIAADGTIWTVGVPNRGSMREEVRRFNPTGKLISVRPVRGRAVKRYGTLAGPESYLVTSPDRVGWVTNAGEYFEYSLDGEPLGRYPAPDDANDAEHETNGAALSPANELLLNVCRGSLRASCHLMQLDRSGRTWRTVERPENEHWERLIGFDGEHPLFRAPSRDGGFGLRQHSPVVVKSEAAQ
jgi:hypothetical protein